MLISNMVARSAAPDVSMDTLDTLPAREMFVTIAPGTLNMDALGSLAFRCGGGVGLNSNYGQNQP